MNSPSGPSEKRGHVDYRSYECPVVDQTARRQSREYTNSVPLTLVNAGNSFGLFNYNSYVSFRAIGLIWGVWELTAELACLLMSSLRLVPTLLETNNQDMKTIYP